MFLIAIVFVIGGCKTLESGVPENFTFIGTKYVNCHQNPAFPLDINEEIITISGKVTEEIGPMKAGAYRIAKINDIYLFDAASGNPISTYPGGSGGLLGERITVKGYRGGC